jgi:hypothetical protein
MLIIMQWIVSSLQSLLPSQYRSLNIMETTKLDENKLKTEYGPKTNHHTVSTNMFSRNWSKSDVR